MNPMALSDDAWVTLLLCSRLGQKAAPGEPEPLRDAAWHTLRIGLEERRARVSGLLGRSGAELQGAFGWNAAFSAQVAALLASDARRQSIVAELARLAERRIWVLSWYDAAYPARLRQRLGPRAPVLLYGAGPPGLLTGRGVAVVGSRHLDPAGEAFAAAIGRRCAEACLAVFSGAAWGADRVAMLASTAAGGQAVGVVAGRLEQLLRDRQFGPLVESGALTLVSKVLPAAGFSVGNAMDRNKLIYCLAERAVVVASSLNTGGTWAGAVENLKREWVPLYVRDGPDVPEGNRALIAAGGLPLGGLAGAGAELPLPWPGRPPQTPGYLTDADRLTRAREQEWPVP